MTNAHARAALFVLAALACVGALRPPSARAQAAAAKEAPASVEGRVTDGEKPVAGVSVALISSEQSGRVNSAARAKTDAEGRYRLTGAQPGRYHVLPTSPVHVFPEAQTYPPGRLVTLEAGEEVKDMDFRLTRGGVITGKVTDADGNPVIGEQVQIVPVDNSPRVQMFRPSPLGNQTDDRGVYRIYGLPPGGYRVSVGQDSESGYLRMGGSGRRYYRRTFHPDATEAEKARVVEVTSGGEATDVDISLGSPAKTYRASGRFVNVETGRPAPDINYGYGMVQRDGREFGPFGGGFTTNARGEFQIENLAPGRYAVFHAALGMNSASSEWISDPLTFEVTEADVTGLEVKLRRGAQVSGLVQLEGVADRAAAAGLLKQLRLAGHMEARGSLSMPFVAQPTINPDGTFRFTGVRAGKLRINQGWPQVKGLMLSRVELNGVTQRDGLEVAEGAQVSGVRLVFLYGNSVVRGQVNLLNGPLAPDARLVVFARRLTAGEEARDGRYARGSEVDARGRFLVEGLAAGEYELTARAFGRQGSRGASQSQRVIVPENGETSVIITLDLNAANPANDK